METFPSRKRRNVLVVLTLATAALAPVVVANAPIAAARPPSIPLAAAAPIAPLAGGGDPGLIGYTIHNISGPSPDITQIDPVGIADDGRVTGMYYDAAARHAFTWDMDGYFAELRTDSRYTFSSAIAPNGTIAGDTYNPGEVPHESYLSLWPTAADGSVGPSIRVAPTGTGTSVPGSSRPVGVNSAGTILLDGATVDPLGVVTPLIGLDGNSRYGVARDINESAMVVGSSNHLDGAGHSTGPDEPTIWHGDVATSLGYPVPGLPAAGVAINDDGDVVVNTIGTFQHAYFRAANGNYVDLGDLTGAEQVGAFDINNNDEIVGSLGTPATGEHAFLWSGGRLVDLNNYVKANSGWILETAYGINEAGQIVGDGSFFGEQVTFVLDPVNPVVFVPGAGASRISTVVATSDVNDADEGQELWLGCGTDRRLLSQWPDDIAEGRAPAQTAAFAPLRHATCYGIGEWASPALDAYGTFLDAMNRSGPYREYRIDGHLERYTDNGCDSDQGRADGGPTPNLFVFAYDWRLDNAKSAQALADFMGCIGQMWPGRKVDIVAHSMGSLVARRYAITTTDAPIERIITIGAPWLGAPRLVNVLQTGDFAHRLVNGPLPVIRDVVGGFPASHQLGASGYYEQVASQPIFTERGWNINGNSTDTENYSAADVSAFLDKQWLDRSTPGATATAFQTFFTPLGNQTDWSADDSHGIDYTHIIGLQSGANTIGTVVATKALQCTWNGRTASCTDQDVIRQNLVCGDGTVPLVSAIRIGNGKDLNGADGDLLVFRSADPSDSQGVEHTGLTANPAVIETVLDLLTTHPDADAPPSDRSGLGAAGQDLDSCTQTADDPENAADRSTGERSNPAATSLAALAAPSGPAAGMARRYISVLGATDVNVADDTGASTALPPAGAGYVEAVDIFASNVDDAALVSLPVSFEHSYTVTFTATGEPLELELLEGTQQTPTSARRWVDLAVPAGALATIELTPSGTATMRYDSDADGAVDTIASPSTVVNGAAASDVEAPDVFVTVTGTGSTARYAFGATDSGSGVATVMWSTNGAEFKRFSEPVTIDDSVDTLYAFAQDRVGNRSQLITVDRAALTPTALTNSTLSPEPNDAGWNQGDVTVTLDAIAADGSNDVAAIVWSADGAESVGETTVVGPTAVIEIAAAGITTVSFHAVGADSSVEPTRTMRVGIDLADPVAAITTPAPNLVVADLSRIAGTTTDDASGAATVELELRNSAGQWWDGTAWVATSQWLPTSGTDNWTRAAGLPTGDLLPPGAYRMRLRTTDASGRQNLSTGQTATVSPAAERRVTPLLQPSGQTSNTSAVAIQEHGLIIGASNVDGALRSIVWRQGTATVLALPPDMDVSQTSDISDDGSVVGAAGRSTTSVATQWAADGSVHELAALAGAEQSQASAISGSVIVGTAGDHPVRWENGVVTSLPTLTSAGTGNALDINTSGVVVGSSIDGHTPTAVMWRNGELVGVGSLGGTGSEATAVNDVGDVVGWANDETGRHRAFLLRDGTLSSLHGVSAAFASTALGLNDRGQVVGEYTTTSDATRAFLWSETTGMIDLNTFLPADSGWVLIRARGINELGQIVGFGHLNGVGRAFVMSALHAPIAEDGEASTASDTPVDVSLDSWDPDAVDALSVAIVGQPLHGSLTAIVDGTVTYTPAPGFAGTDTFTFNATDGRFDSNIAAVLITVIDDDGGSVRPPLAAISSEASVGEGSTVTFDAAASVARDGAVISAYSWDLDGDGQFDDGSGPAVTHPAFDDGTAVAALRVTDSRGATGEAQATVTITNVVPSASILPDNDVLLSGASFEGVGVITDAGPHDTHTATIDYGDGSPVSDLAVDQMTFAFRHTYDAPGTSVVTVEICDDDGGCSTNTATVQVHDRPTDSIVPAGASAFVPLTPTRIFDTRPDTPGPGPTGLVAAGATIDVQVAGVGGVPDDATAVVINLTATDTVAAGFVTAWPTGTERPLASSLNVTGADQTRPSLLIVPIGSSGRISIFSQSGTNLLGDVTGYFRPTDVAVAAGRIVPITPTRVFDTRPDTSGPGPKGAVAAGSTIKVQIGGVAGVPTNATAVVMNVTATDTNSRGYITVWPSGTTRPLASTLNVDVAGETVSNLVIMPIGVDGKVSFFAQSGTHLLADVTGWVTGSTEPTSLSGLFVPLDPSRLFDTRPGQEPDVGPKGFVNAGETITEQFAGINGVPSDVGLVFAGLTVSEAATGFVTCYPTGTSRPVASVLNMNGPGDTRRNSVVMPLGPNGSIELFTQAGAHILADIAGYTIG